MAGKRRRGRGSKSVSRTKTKRTLKSGARKVCKCRTVKRGR